MKLNKDIWKFNKTVKILTVEEQVFTTKINSYFNELKLLFLNEKIHLKKVGDFAYHSYIKVNNVINLDLCAIKYLKGSAIKISDLSETILRVSKTYNVIPEIHTDKNYINLVFNYKNVKINFRIVSVIANIVNNEEKYWVNRNGLKEADIVLKLTRDFKVANRLSSGLLVNLKRLINYTLKNEFNYTYDADYYLLRWFNEYLSKSLESFIYERYIKKELELNIKEFMKHENLRKWIKRNISFFDLTNFIFIKLDSVNTYYFNQFNFEYEEIFDGISRYSINTNSTFKIPIDYLSSVKLFDTNLLEDKTYIQENLSNENGVSNTSWDKFKNYRHRYIVSPIIQSGVANYAMFQKWLTVKSNELYGQLNQDLKSEIKSTKQREAMTELNDIANRWLTKYNTKLKYLQPYFDRKYPFYSNYQIEQLVSLIIESINKIDEEQWNIKNDN
ncbi:hypothetical protein [Spiroplasma cantharicola]|uniref:Uncharacterized protein n=1 Tax=Spiroplasma cantharicola TaxID=362837 RepID=A0A0M4K140_9MOLU|nr:hypothetical protein [Spiroplasma cantharicola]ALD66262.1 hypothetical protein SCANT_v1c03520 [Spiroplasma cantharicola]